MERGRGCKAKNWRKMVNLDSEAVLVIRVLDAQVLRIVSRSLLLGIVLPAMLFLGSIAKGFPSNSNSVVVSASSSYSPKRKLLQMATDEAKTTALKGLEDVLLEPPRKASPKSKKNLKKIKYLPDLLDDSLRGYKRRLFVAVGVPEENKGVIQWFEHNYPKKSAKFEIHSLLVAPENPAALRTDVSSWLSKHVKEEEYVVMKAEADVVEEMVKRNTMTLVDELFLECSNEWWQIEKRRNSGRAYWECLALYGRLRDEGVAVHQWWG